MANVLTPLIIFHGERDERCPVEQARLYAEAAQREGKGGLIIYHELEGVGTQSHWGNITPEQEAFRMETGEAFIRENPRPIALPRQGRFVVAGYVKTKQFEVILDSIDRVGEVTYDLDRETFDLTAPSARAWVLRRRRDDGTWTEETRSLAD